MLNNYKYDLNLFYGNLPFMIGVSVPGQSLPSRPATQSLFPEESLVHFTRSSWLFQFGNTGFQLGNDLV